MINNGRWKTSYFFLFFPIIITVLSLQLPIFWDGTYYSRVASWFLESNFQSLLLPQQIDAGHPPFFSLYLAITWKIFGKTLPVSHLAMLPFSIGIFWQLKRLVIKFFTGKEISLLFLLLALEPTLLAQCSMISYELALVFFYLMGLNSIIRKQNFFLFLSLAVLNLLSLRGMLAGGSLFITHMIWQLVFKEKVSVRAMILVYFPAFGIGIYWLVWHYLKTGWWIMTPSENWTGQRHLLSINDMFYNVGIILWRLFDFGRIALYFVLLASAFVILKKEIFKERDFQKLVLFIVVPLLCFSLFFIPFSNPIGHRYFIIIYLLVSIMVYYVLLRCFQTRMRHILVVCISISLISGHFWIYPDGIAKGWDSSLAHLPYFKQRVQMIKFIEEQQINVDEIGTEFPNEVGLKYTDLDDIQWHFKSKDFNRDQYIIESNIFNGFSDEELSKLCREWKLLKEYRNAGVYMRLYKKANNNY